MAPGTYSISDADQNGEGEEYLGHGVWLNGFLTGPDTEEQNYQASEWSIVEQSATVGVEGTSLNEGELQFSATVQNY